jgi:transposase
MDVIGKVRRLKLRDKLSTSAIARATGLSRNTVKKWLKAPGDIAPKYVREAPEGKLTPFKGALDQALKTDMHRPKKGRRTGRALFAQIQAQGYRGGYSAVTDFVRAWHEQSSQPPSSLSGLRVQKSD